MIGADGRAEPPRATVLVVEDEALIRLMLVEALEDDGYQVLEADDAAGAVRLLEGQRDVDLVVTDVRMPGEMDGLHLAQWIKQNRPRTKVIISSGYVASLDDQHASGAFDAFVGKPYRMSDVVKRVALLLHLA